MQVAKNILNSKYSCYFQIRLTYINKTILQGITVLSILYDTQNNKM